MSAGLFVRLLPLYFISICLVPLHVKADCRPSTPAQYSVPPSTLVSWLSLLLPLCVGYPSYYPCVLAGFGDLVALQQDNALEEKPEYVTFALFFIMFGLAVIAAVLNLMVLKFMTMNTEDEKRDEIEAIQVGEAHYKAI